MSKEQLPDLENYINESPAVLLYFYSHSCAPCVSLRPKVEALVKEEFPRMQFKLIDSAANPEVTAHFNVFSNPVILIYFEGHEHGRMSKYISIQQLEAAIQRPYQMIFE
jgi:thioredoxin 1